MKMVGGSTRGRAVIVAAELLLLRFGSSLGASSTVALAAAGPIGDDQLSVLGNNLLIGGDPFLGDIFLIDLNLAAAPEVAKRVFSIGFVFVKPPNLRV
jgi:hypothetical protein